MWYIVISQFLPSLQSPVPSPQTVHYAVFPRCRVVGNHQLKMVFKGTGGVGGGVKGEVLDLNNLAYVKP